MLFKPKFEIIDKIDCFTQAIDENWIINEPMFQKSSLDYARQHGLGLTQTILDFLTDYLKPEYGQIIVDSRVRLIKKGQIGSAPGYHCDFIPRENGKSRFDLINSKAFHILCNVASSIPNSQTEFLLDEVQIDIPEDNPWWHINNFLNICDLRTKFLPEGVLALYDQQTLHRATPCQNDGWRLFFRVSAVNEEPVNQYGYFKEGFARKNDSLYTNMIVNLKRKIKDCLLAYELEEDFSEYKDYINVNVESLFQLQNYWEFAGLPAHSGLNEFLDSFRDIYPFFQ
jgi:hypothetical protein